MPPWLLLVVSVSGLAAPVGENEVKAAFLVNFIFFIEWPESAISSPKKEIKFCVLGDNPFVQNLDYVIQKKNASAQPRVQLSLSYFAHWERDQIFDCHLLYISKSEKHQLHETLKALVGYPILTVSSIPGFARQGGGVEFFIQESKLRFHLNLDALHLNGLNANTILVKLSVPTTTEPSILSPPPPVATSSPKSTLPPKTRRCAPWNTSTCPEPHSDQEKPPPPKPWFEPLLLTTRILAIGLSVLILLALGFTTLCVKNLWFKS